MTALWQPLCAHGDKEKDAHLFREKEAKSFH
jgi:hypothetical protein